MKQRLHYYFFRLLILTYLHKQPAEQEQAPALSYPLLVVLERNPGESYGLRLYTDDKKRACIIKGTTEDGIAAASGLIHGGEIILKINNESVLNMPHNSIISRIGASGSSLSLLLTIDDKLQEYLESVLKQSQLAHGLVMDDPKPDNEHVCVI